MNSHLPQARLARVIFQLVWAALLMVAAAGLVFLIGGMLLPDPSLHPGSQPPSLSKTSESLALPRLEELEGTTAVILVEGDIRGRFVLDRLNDSSLSDEGRFSLSFRNGELDSLVITGRGEPGTPIPGDSLDVSAALAGINFYGFQGQCSGELDSIQQAETIFVKDFWYVGPIGAGTVSCSGLTGLSSDQTISFQAVFRFDQRECAGSCE